MWVNGKFLSGEIPPPHRNVGDFRMFGLIYPSPYKGKPCAIDNNDIYQILVVSVIEKILGPHVGLFQAEIWSQNLVFGSWLDIGSNNLLSHISISFNGFLIVLNVMWNLPLKNQLSSETNHRISLIFCIKLAVNKSKKVTKPDFYIKIYLPQI